MIFKCLFFIVAIFLFFSKELSAATVKFNSVVEAEVNFIAYEAVPLEKISCNILFDGDIETGDVQKIDRIIKNYWHSNVMFRPSITVCLDSDGGDFYEGVELAKYFSDNSIATVVQNGASCRSACAIAFMFGATTRVESNPTVRFSKRFLHVGGTLGFHAPFNVLLDGKQKYDFQLLDGELTRSREIFTKLFFLINEVTFSRQPAISNELLANMFSHKGESEYRIETILQAHLNDIQVFGDGLNVEISESTAIRLCNDLGDIEGVSDHFGNSVKFDESMRIDKVIARQILQEYLTPHFVDYFLDDQYHYDDMRDELLYVRSNSAFLTGRGPAPYCVVSGTIVSVAGKFIRIRPMLRFGVSTKLSDLKR